MLTGVISKTSTVAEAMADYFSKIDDDNDGKYTSDLFEKGYIGHPSVLKITKNWRNNANCEFRTANKVEVEKAGKRLKPNKATGYDFIHPKALKLAAPELAPSLSEILNQ